MPAILGFVSHVELAEHFHRHVTRGREFSFADEDEYEAAAIDFLSRSLDADTEETLRSRDNTIVRYNKVTKELAYLHSDGYIGSYYKVRVTDGYAYYKRRCT